MFGALSSKRGRSSEDGQVSRAEYDFDDEYDQNSSNPGKFSRASFGTLSNRRIVSAKRVDKRQEYIRHVKALNESFSTWFNQQIRMSPGANLITATQDWLDYRLRLEERYLKTYGEVLTFGSGDCGQLAHGMDKDEDMMVKFPRVVYSLRDKKVCQVACGGLHNAVVTEMGQVYTWGCSDDGSLGRDGEESIPALVEDMVSKDPVIGVACGDGQTICVTACGDVYAWGCFKDKEGKKWFSKDTTNPGASIKRQQDKPMKVSGLKNVVEVVCGSVYSLALCEDGSAWSWGLGESGELGRQVCPTKAGPDAPYNMEGIENDHLTPAPMQTSSGEPVHNVRTMGAGAYHSMVVIGNESTARSGLYTCGLSNYGQLGLGNNENRFLLTRVDCASFYLTADGDTDSIISARGGMHHSIVLLSSGRVFAFGRADAGQLGLARYSESNGGKAGDFCAVPTEVKVCDSSTKIVSIAAGGSHNMALASDGSIYSWGYGDMLALGHGVEKDEPTPRKINLSKAKLDDLCVTQLSCGGQHSAIIGSISSAY